VAVFLLSRSLLVNTLPHGGLALAALDEMQLPAGTKGLPISEPLRQGAIGAQGWNVLGAQTSFPVAVLKESALRHNLAWMKALCDRHGVVLAPHGKTTMSPQLFGAQLANGAWGITLATMIQVSIAQQFGVRRVLLANQLVGPADIAMMTALLRSDPDFELVVLVDSMAGVNRLSSAMLAAGLGKRLPVLLELGLAGKRAGCRTDEEAVAVARAIAKAPGLVLAGVEGYEGLLDEPEAVKEFVRRIVDLMRAFDAESLFASDSIIISAGGSAYFDLVARGFSDVSGLSRPVASILRSGCYLTKDHGTYLRHMVELDAREQEDDGLRPALEVWSMVQSLPEPGLAILTMGKRDASYDVELPIPLMHHRPGPGTPAALPEGCTIFKMNDQHAYLRMPAGFSLQIGDLVGCGISHPCTTFDKWQVLLAVDDAYNVKFAINTFF
jgi:D-serine dehydratase